MRLSRLPTLGELQRQRRAIPKYAVPSRLEERQTERKTAVKREALVKRMIWARAKGRCERCGRFITKGVDSLTAGHVHHKRKRSQGGTWQAKNLICLCTFCHREVHS